MIRRLFRWRHWRARARYWHLRAAKAEASLEAECLRNREREDTLVAVPMRLGGLFGIQPRSAPALARPQSRPIPAPIAAASPWDALTWADKQEFDMYWKPDAEAAGISLQQAQQKFLAEIAQRRIPLNDEPFS